MALLLLAPYNDSIQLGQGFNSFLQIPCITGAVQFSESDLKAEASRAGGAANVSQTVSSNSRFVEKMSEVARSMNVSAASSIKSGTIGFSGNSMSVDEGKFSASDMNAVVSVNVVNQTITTPQQATFVPLKDVQMNSAKFFEIYGDCYVSGFVEGGDLHGIVSVRVLDASKKSEVQSAIESQINGGGTATSFTLSDASVGSGLEEALKHTETSVSVSWSGGGQIKPDSEEWTLDSLMRAAAAFPSRVAECPQRTWVILTRYTDNREFVEWASDNNIKLPDFVPVQNYSSELLDCYMEFKHNLNRLQSVMANPSQYRLSKCENPIPLDIWALVKERELIRGKMRKIAGRIDLL
ncbi:hypothetical protein N7462_002114 [Penicillium macrosclerotiorum]|uniref:uncharacterized protein n=1 Tax=Penicillium macrosclerotiorum TaxID=303699 RepID=UPI002548D7FC|nr:uncharacterized protein N7462_002114 [Penicillium macrosclerotiorum]KAJ5692691.1 hypothetical protein N7462_002114 [Penicillium macrosclerotiorum]